MTHGEFYELIDSNVGSLEGDDFRRFYTLRIEQKLGSTPQMKSRMTETHLEIAIAIAHIRRVKRKPRYQAVVDALTKELDRLRAPIYNCAQQALKQVQEELKKLQAEIELLEHDLQQEQAANVQIQQMLNEAQAENKQLKTLIHQLQTQPLSEQLKKLTEMARQLEIDLESEKEARARAEAKAGAIPTGDGRTVHIHANTVNLNDIHHNDNNNTQIHS